MCQGRPHHVRVQFHHDYSREVVQLWCMHPTILCVVESIASEIDRNEING